MEKEGFGQIWYLTRFFFAFLIILWVIEFVRIFTTVTGFKDAPSSFFFYLDLVNADYGLIFVTVIAFFMSAAHLAKYNEKTLVLRIFIISFVLLIIVIARLCGFLCLVPFVLGTFSLSYWIKIRRQARPYITKPE